MPLFIRCFQRYAERAIAFAMPCCFMLATCYMLMLPYAILLLRYVDIFRCCRCHDMPDAINICQRYITPATDAATLQPMFHYFRYAAAGHYYLPIDAAACRHFFASAIAAICHTLIAAPFTSPAAY